MARVPMVTRTIPTTAAQIVCVNVEDRSVFEQIITLPRTYKDENKLMKQIEAVLKNEPVKPIGILKTEVHETLYGMSEQDFIKNATVLDPKTRK